VPTICEFDELGAPLAWWLSEAKAEADFVLRVRFADGMAGYIDMSELVGSDRAGVFATLRNPEIFAQVRIEHGAPSWPGDVDLAPDAMHAEIAANGCWTPKAR
jgi:hypothetical protein